MAIEGDAGNLLGGFDIGTITIACALGYLDLRFPDFGWRVRFPEIAAWETRISGRPALIATRPT